MTTTCSGSINQVYLRSVVEIASGRSRILISASTLIGPKQPRRRALDQILNTSPWMIPVDAILTTPVAETALKSSAEASA